MTFKEDIKEFLADVDNATLSDIYEASDKKPEVIRGSINAMVKTGEVIRVSRGVYKLKDEKATEDNNAE